jgi:(E)-4-hydroxy-3-methylbut-2-enyl-diphosphate synthase
MSDQTGRRKTRQLYIGNVPIGGDAPISIQSMTSCPTKNIPLVLAEIKRLEEAGCEIVRLGIPDEESARAIRLIKNETRIPIVADIHFDYRLALESIEAGADALRINPGNLRNKEQVQALVKACRDKNIPIRIGVNSGSIDKTRFSHPTAEALVDSALEHIKILEELEFFEIKVSLKSSHVPTMVRAYRLFAEIRDYPLHLGVTEAGTYEQAIVKSSIGIGALLLDGIGDTIRVSITGDVVKEIEAARTILRSLGLRKEGIEIISCPTCARKEFDVEAAVNELLEKTKHVKKYLKVAVMGCVVNGPGEASEADVGVAVGKTGAVLFKNGKVIKNISKDQIISALLEEIFQ